MVKHNNVIPNQHFKKKWQFMVKTWFNQPARKHRRAVARRVKAAKEFPRPVSGSLKPVVSGQTVKYNSKKRFGRGFTLEELKEAQISAKFARTIGISVDHRRQNRSLESLQANAQRLKEYTSSLVLFPKKANKPKKGDSSKEELSAVQQHTGTVLPIKHDKYKLETIALSDELKDFEAYEKLRVERMNAKQFGPRAKKVSDAAAEEKDKAK